MTTRRQKKYRAGEPDPAAFAFKRDLALPAAVLLKRRAANLCLCCGVRTPNQRPDREYELVCETCNKALNAKPKAKSKKAILAEGCDNLDRILKEGQ